MDIFEVIILALIQGLSEFLPISSSAHLILVPKLLGWSDQGLAFDVAVHIGTLLAVVIYFRADLAQILSDFFKSIAQRKQIGQSNIAWGVGFGTIPVGLCGLAFADFIEANLRSPLVIASTTIIFGLLLYIADKKSATKTEISIKTAIFIGIFQALALIPGVSRSGITITAALLLGLNSTQSAKFSFLLSIPVIILAGGLELIKLTTKETHVEYSLMILGILISFASAYLCIKWFLNFINKTSMNIFVIYRVLLGMFLFYVFL